MIKEIQMAQNLKDLASDLYDQAATADANGDYHLSAKLLSSAMALEEVAETLN